MTDLLLGAMSRFLWWLSRHPCRNGHDYQLAESGSPYVEKLACSRCPAWHASHACAYDVELALRYYRPAPLPRKEQEEP